MVEVPEGWVNQPDLTKRFPDCCVNIIKLENATKIDANQTKIDVVNQTTIDGNVSKSDDNLTKFENTTKIEDNVINDNQKKLR